MSGAGEMIGKALGTVIRGTGTVIAGSVGVVSKVMGASTSALSGEASQAFSDIGDACFGYAKEIWTGKPVKHKEAHFNKEKAKLECLLSQEKNLKSFIENKEAQKRWLEEKGIDPQLADDPLFIEFLERKAERKMEESKTILSRY